VLNAVSSLLDGAPAAASSAKRNRRILNVAMEYAVKQGMLRSNPLAEEARDLPENVVRGGRASAAQPHPSCRSVGLGPTSAARGTAAPRVLRDVRLPDEGTEDQWGELLFHTALSPRSVRTGPTTARSHEERGLKGRAKGVMRSVPCRPALTKVLRAHIQAEGLKPGDLLCLGEKGEVLAGSVIRRARRSARREVLDAQECASPLGRRVYGLRHTCLTNRLNDGVPPTHVAEWAGNSVPVLLAI
jgi:hypothetical protein